MSKKRPSKYYVPELGIEIKVESLGSSNYVAHYPTGPERASFSEVREKGWEFRGEWKEESNEVK